jgi:hypothetical protein
MDLKTGKTVDRGPICGAPLNEEPFRSIPNLEPGTVLHHLGSVRRGGSATARVL